MQIAYVEFDDTKVKFQDIIGTVENAGYKCSEEYSFEIENANESKILKIKFIISICLSIPLMYLAMFHPYINGFTPKLNSLIQFILATPVMFMGYQFFTNGFITLFKIKRATML